MKLEERVSGVLCFVKFKKKSLGPSSFGFTQRYLGILKKKRLITDEKVKADFCFLSFNLLFKLGILLVGAKPMKWDF